MSQISESHLFNIQDTNIFQAIAELVKANNAKTGYKTKWQNKNSVEFEVVPSALMSDSKVVIFGELTWQKLIEFEQKLVSLFGGDLFISVSKPSDELAGAVQFNLPEQLLSEGVSSDSQSELQNWAETNHVELCITNKAPTLDVPGLLVMDMDSTAIQIECIDEIAKLAGVGEQVAEVTAKAMAGELDFAESLRARVATLTDAPVSVIDQVADNLPLMPGLENLVSVLQQHHWKIVVASGGFTYMTEVLKRDLGLDKTVANQLEMANGKLTGRVLGDIIDAQAKADTVNSLSKEWGIPLSQTIAMGDGANDLTMMAAANLGVAFHAKPLVRKEADVSVRHGGLDQLLYLL